MSVTEAELSMRPAEHRNGETYKGSLLHSEGSVSRQNSAEEDLKIRRQMHKQESKDSGIVTEMSTRPKDYGRSKTEKIHRSDSSKVKSRKSDSFKSSVKRSQSMKTSNSGRNFSQSSNRSTGNLKDLDSDNQVRRLFKISFSIFYRNLANHLYSKVYETQGDMCCKRNEIRLANLQLAAIRAQVRM